VTPASQFDLVDTRLAAKSVWGQVMEFERLRSRTQTARFTGRKKYLQPTLRRTAPAQAAAGDSRARRLVPEQVASTST
jgi:hypothetical protein